MVGGIETITMQLAQTLTKSEFTRDEPVCVTVVTPGQLEAANEIDFPFTMVRNPGLAHLVKLIWRSDILHIAGTDLLPLFLAWLLRKRVVVEHHGFQVACPNGQMVYTPDQSPCPGHYMAGRHSECLKCNVSPGVLHSWKQWLLTFPRRWLCARARANVMPTEWLGSVLRLPRMVTIHHGLPTSVIPSARTSITPKIVFLGRLVSTKGVHVLLKAAQLLDDLDFRLDIIGDGPERKRLEDEVRLRSLKGRVIFRGYLPAAEVENVVADARAVVMPSLAGEVFGLVALENMLRKKVLIVSEIGALTEVVGNTGLAFPTGNAEALAACLRQVLQSDSFVEETGARAADRARSLFSVERMVSEHLLLYRRLLAHHSGDQALIP